MTVNIFPNPSTAPGPYGVRYVDPATGAMVRRGCVPAGRHWRKGTLEQALAEKARLEQTSAVSGMAPEEAARQWLRYKEALNKRPSTLVEYRKVMRLFQAGVPVPSLSLITRAHLDDLIVYLSRERGLSPVTVRTTLTIIKDFLRWCSMSGRGWIADPRRLTDGLHLPKRDRVEAEPFSLTQWQALLAAANGAERYNLQMLYYTGLRISAWERLAWPDVNFERGEYRVTQTKSRTDKTKKLNATARALLWQHRQEPTPCTIGADQLRRCLKTLGQLCGIAPRLCHPHTIRHTAVSYLIDRGANIKLVQEFCDHASAKTTLDVYGHLFRDRSQETVDLLDSPEMGYSPLKIVTGA